MEPYMFTNGLPVLYYLDILPLIKIRNVSKAMRKRATFIFRNNKTIFKPPDGLIVYSSPCEYERILKNQRNNLKGKIILKGLNSTKTDNQVLIEQILRKFCDLTKITVLDAFSVFWDYKYSHYLEGRYGTLSADYQEKEIYEKLVQIDRNSLHKALVENKLIYHFDIFKDDINLDNGISKLLDLVTIENVNALSFPSFEIPEIIPKLNRIKYVRIVYMQSYFHDLSKADWSKTIHNLRLEGVTIEKEIELPNLNELSISNNSKGFSKIKCDKLEILYWGNMNQSYSEIAVFKSLKVLDYSGIEFNRILKYLPRNLRHISIRHTEDRDGLLHPINTREIISKFPYLIKLKTSTSNNYFKIDDLLGGTIKEATVSNEFNSCQEYLIRLKKVEINRHNYKLFNEHPEIISTCSNIKITSDEFDWKHLPNTLKFFESYWGVRVNQERGEKYLDKLKNCIIRDIGIEKAEYARKVMKIARKVDRMICDDRHDELKEEFKGTRCMIIHPQECFGSSWKRNLNLPVKKKRKCSIF